MIDKRLGADGLPADDVTENPKAAIRKKLELETRARREAERLEPWSRQKVEREIIENPSVSVAGGTEVRYRGNLSGADLSGLDLSGVDLSYVNMDGAKLVGTNLSGCRLVGATLHAADLTGAVLEKVNAVGVNFHGACLCASKSSRAHFMGANLSEVCFEGSDGVDIVQKPLTPAEEKLARHRQSEGFKVDVSLSAGKVTYFGPSLERANVSGMRLVCKKRKTV